MDLGVRNLGCGIKKCMEGQEKKKKYIWRQGSVVKLETFSLKRDSLLA